jgi:hypothetical protein
MEIRLVYIYIYIYIYVHVFLTSALVGENGHLHDPAILHPGKEQRYPWIGGWVGPRAGVNEIEM